jgi:hypothetical protein
MMMRKKKRERTIKYNREVEDWMKTIQREKE